mmetsp:Transcript_25194/g.33743  ORF Transcript_25194/g.33743 Transcript_25194/m.33743 type:complete len:80 (-) Transcript_25194:687-926(-)
MPECDPESGLVTSRHVLICVSGFLSESGSYAKSWEFLVAECRARNVPLYTIKWEAKDMGQLENIVLNQAKQSLAPMLNG